MRMRICTRNQSTRIDFSPLHPVPRYWNPARINRTAAIRVAPDFDP